MPKCCPESEITPLSALSRLWQGQPQPLFESREFGGRRRRKDVLPMGTTSYSGEWRQQLDSRFEYSCRFASYGSPIRPSLAQPAHQLRPDLVISGRVLA